jgi:hypothetical protein
MMKKDEKDQWEKESVGFGRASDQQFFSPESAAVNQGTPDKSQSNYEEVRNDSPSKEELEKKRLEESEKRKKEEIEQVAKRKKEEQEEVERKKKQEIEEVANRK